MSNALQDQVGFHEYKDVILTRAGQLTARQDPEFTYTFENFFHPFVGELIEKLNKESLSGVLDPNFHQELADKFGEFFDDFYEPRTSDVVKFTDFPKKEIDVSIGGPYATYNWELLFHIPLTIAVHLSKNQRFAEAQRWFHYIFDPTSNDTSNPVPERFWKFLAFRKPGSPSQIDELLALLSKPEDECSSTELDRKKMIMEGYRAIQDKPFQPHVVARTRHVAYQYCVVMKYLDNLIAWGDSLFRQDTIESINEATQRYVLAANILGPLPQRIPSRGTVRPKTFAQLKAQGLGPMGNALVELEGKFPFNLGSPKIQKTDPDAAEQPFGIGRTLYFCLPRNDKLLGYWDTVADRLFKIRHCMNIEGVVRQLALFEPPIDPGMLVKAAAAGIDVGSIVSGLNQPVGPVRCLSLIQKALELCGEVRGLGGALLAAMEKGDGEHLAQLRQGHETNIQQMVQEARFLQWKQAQESTQSLLRSRGSPLERYRYHQRLLGLTPDNNTAPDTFAIDQSVQSDDLKKLTEATFDEAYANLVKQYDKAVALQAYPQLKLAGDASPANQSGASGKGNLYLNTSENADLNEHLPNVKEDQTIAFGARQIAPVFSLIPDFPINLHFWGIGGTIVLGGSSLTKNVQTGADILDLMASRESHDAYSASKTASSERRADDWRLQSNLAAHELMHIGRQILGSLIAEQVAHHEYLNVKKQIENSQEVDRFLQQKFTNEELYTWMQGEISRLYYEYYRFAFDTARKAEQTMKQELLRPEVDATDYIKFNYWDGGRKGLLAGEALYLDIKRMEMAYHENNKREYELTKHVSLRQLDPLALLELKTIGSCEVTVPEWLFDLDCPGHYMRRIKNVSLSLPSVTGPYTSISCTLSLLRSSLRKLPLGDDYARKGPEDDRFVDYFGTIQSVVTSSGNNDSGMFETNLRDEQFLPFEGTGAVSTWKLELPSTFRQFDYNTISDVILHVRYTARQGGEQLRKKAVEHIQKLPDVANTSGLLQLFSLRHDFPSEWHSFVTGNENLKVTVKEEYFPYFVQGRKLDINKVELRAIKDNRLLSAKPSNVDVALLTTHLQTQKEFEVSLAPDNTVLVRKDEALVFLLFEYSIS
jgi:hypothetical protein